MIYFHESIKLKDKWKWADTSLFLLRADTSFKMYLLKGFNVVLIPYFEKFELLVPLFKKKLSLTKWNHQQLILFSFSSSSPFLCFSSSSSTSYKLQQKKSEIFKQIQKTHFNP
jgi:hypothetical protein